MALDFATVQYNEVLLEAGQTRMIGASLRVATQSASVPKKSGAFSVSSLLFDVGTPTLRLVAVDFGRNTVFHENQ